MKKTDSKGLSAADREFYKNFVSDPPTKVFTVGCVTTKLYGPVSPERAERELRATTYRADQLAPVVQRVEREPLVYGKEDGEYFTEEDDISE